MVPLEHFLPLVQQALIIIADELVSLPLEWMADFVDFDCEYRIGVDSPPPQNTLQGAARK